MSRKISIPDWIKQNEQFLEPPVMNKLMYGEGQLKVMYVGGPNIRSDYHLEQGEELFYMERGAMTVKVIVRGKPVDVHIKEGEMFILPGRIPHSPQRFPNTLGLVIERERSEKEWDCLRWYMPSLPDTPTPLYEEFFHCFDLGVQLKPVIQRFYASEQHKTGFPIEGTITSNPPITPNSDIDIPSPFNLKQWIQENAQRIASSKLGFEDLSTEKEFKIVFHAGTNSSSSIFKTGEAEAWIWQWQDSSKILQKKTNLDDENSGEFEEPQKLEAGECTLIPAGTSFKIEQSESSQLFVISMIPEWMNQ